MSQTVDAEVVQEQQTMAVAVRPPEQQLTVWGTTDPGAIVERATDIANRLKAVMRAQKLISNISGKEYPRCEAWTLCGTLVGVFPVCVWTRPLEQGFEARVEARLANGAVVGAAEAQCLRSERNWSNRDDFALRSMAQTRATAKCLRMPLGFIMTLAGYEATPAEEMATAPVSRPRSTPPAPRPAPAPAAAPSAKPVPAPTAAPAKPEIKLATEATRTWMECGLAAMESLAVEYFQKLTDPAVLMPGEGLKDLPWQWVPIGWNQLKALQDAITEFGNGADAKHPYPPNPVAEAAKPKAAAKAAPKPKAEPQSAKSSIEMKIAELRKKAEWFWPVIIPVPQKGMKKADYDKKPDTIESLYTAVKEGDQAAQARLFGLAKKWHPEPREWNGKVYQATDADHICRAALDDFVDWEEKHRGDAQPDPEDEQDDIPF